MSSGAQIIPLRAALATGHLLAAAEATARAHYGAHSVGTGESAIAHAAAVAATMAAIGQDEHAIAAGWLFAVPHFIKDWREPLEPAFGPEVARLVDGLARLHKLRDITRSVSIDSDAAQTETLRKMLLAMVADVRVVLIRLTSRLQTLRYLIKSDDLAQRRAVGRETLDFYAPLANRRGVWQLKWELEDQPSVAVQISPEPFQGLHSHF